MSLFKFLCRIILVGMFTAFITIGYFSIQDKLNSILEIQKLNSLQLMIFKKELEITKSSMSNVGKLKVKIRKIEIIEPTDDEIVLVYIPKRIEV